MTIGEVALRAGIPASTLRFYEKEKLIMRPSRVSGRRDYDGSVFLSLELIRMALNSGFSIREARTLIHGFSSTIRPSQRWRTLAAQKLSEVQARIAQLQRAEKLLIRTTACECSSLADCAKFLLPTASTEINSGTIELRDKPASSRKQVMEMTEYGKSGKP